MRDNAHETGEQVQSGASKGLVASLPRCLVASLPSRLAASLPRRLAASLPRCPVVALSLLLLALAPRVLALNVFLTADERFWTDNTRRFFTGLLSGDYTLTRPYHTPGIPAVTTMWLGVIGLWGKHLWQVVGGSSQSLWDFVTSVPVDPSVSADYLTALRLPNALLTALCIAAFYLLLKRLLPGRLAFFAAALVALDPFYLAHSRLLHHDALVTTFIVLAVLSFVVYGWRGRPRWALVVSGLATGLALLSKGSALFLLPFTGLLALAAYRRRPGRAAWRWASALAVWGALAVALFAVLWPSVWVDPFGSVFDFFAQVVGFGTSAHEVGNTFLGRPAADPGPLFYPAVLLLRTTPFTLIGAALGAGWWARARFQTSEVSKDFGSLDAQLALAEVCVVFVALFALFLTAGLKKFDRYLLPAFPFLDVLAAMGWYRLARAVAVRRTSLALAGALAVQAAFSLPHFPYYLTAYNPLVGGGWLAPRVFWVGWGEGLDEAARYLNGQPGAEHLRMAAWLGLSAPFFRGQTWHLGEESGESALVHDYTVFYVNQFQRQRPTAEVVRYFRQSRRPEHVVRLRGVDYAWVYPGPVYGFAPPRSMTHSLGASFGDRAVLLGFDADGRVASGGTLYVTLYWQALAEMGEDYNVTLRVVDDGGRVWAQRDRWPVDGLVPTGAWRPGMVVRDDYALTVPPGTPPGAYHLRAGLYSAATGRALEAASADGASLGQMVTLAPVTVVRPARPPDPDAVPMARRLRARLSPEVELLGYDFAGGTVQPGQRVEVTLYWRARRAVARDYAVALRLVDGAGRVRREWVAPPVGGRYPTTGWARGEVVADVHRLTVPANVESGEYGVTVALFGVGEPAAVELGRLTVAGRERSFAVPSIQHPHPANFDDKIQLLGYDLEAGSWKLEAGVRLTLYWRALAEMDTSYTVFVHVLDAEGRIVAQRDSVPGSGALPTTGWVAGEVIVDGYEVPLREGTPPGEYTVEVGLYDAATGQRLPVVGGGGDRVVLQKIELR